MADEQTEAAPAEPQTEVVHEAAGGIKRRNPFLVFLFSYNLKSSITDMSRQFYHLFHIQRERFRWREEK